MDNAAASDVNQQEKNKSTKKIFIPAIGSLGDVKPFMILATELQKRGHTVLLGVHKRYEEQVKMAGIDTVEMGGDIETALNTTPEGIQLKRNPSVFSLNLVKRVFTPLMGQWFEGVLSGLKDIDLIVLPITAVLAGLSCIEKSPNIKAVGIFTVPCIPTVEFSPPSLSGGSTSWFNWINTIKWKLFKYSANTMYGEQINQQRAKVGLPAIKLDYDELVQRVLRKPMLTATIYSKYLLPRPADWSANNLMVGPIIQDNMENFQPPEGLLEFLEQSKDQRIIYVGVGSMMSMMFSPEEQRQFLTNMQTGIENTSCKAVFSLVGFQDVNEEHLKHSSKIFYLKQTIPHTWLFPQLSAAIHHGGAGTTHASLRYGLPTLVIPFGADQPFNADRVFINRLGPKAIYARQLNSTNLTMAIQNLLSNYSAYQNNAQRIAQLMKEEDGLEQCIQMIEKELQT